jgi:hypothetical protein
MGLLSTILSKLGLGHAGATATAAPSASAAPAKTSAPSASPAAPVSVSVVDVVAHLESLAAANPEKLNWKLSIVDLLKLLGIDSSYGARKDLATELSCPPALMADSAQMNMWLHRAVLQKIAQNGGNIPPELLA